MISGYWKTTEPKLPGNVREVWVPKGKLLAGPIATRLKWDTSTSLSPPRGPSRTLPGSVYSMDMAKVVAIWL